MSLYNTRVACIGFNEYQPLRRLVESTLRRLRCQLSLFDQPKPLRSTPLIAKLPLVDRGVRVDRMLTRWRRPSAFYTSQQGRWCAVPVNEARVVIVIRPS